MTSALISSNALHALLQSSSTVVLLDASWHLPNAGRNAFAEYQHEAIAGALFWDIDALADTASPYPHMLLSPDAFSAAMQRMGIGQNDTVVIYDSVGLFSAARVWWYLRVMGHTGPVYVLDGGLPAWKAAGLPVAAGEASATGRSATYHAQLHASLCANRGMVLAALQSRDAQVVDARAAARYQGQVPEPRPGVRCGHMPGSINVPFQAVLTPAPSVQLLPAQQLLNVLATHGVAPNKPTIFSCGSGVTACVLALAWHEAGLGDARVYDGSWAEWGRCDDLPVAVQACAS